MGYGLIDVGRDQKDMAMSSMKSLADQEELRNRTSDQIKQQKKSNAMAAAGTGASLGLSVATSGAAVGGLAP